MIVVKSGVPFVWIIYSNDTSSFKGPLVSSFIDNIFIQGLLASFTLSSKMLYDAVKDVVSSDNLEIKKEKISTIELDSACSHRENYLTRPDLGRILSENSKTKIKTNAKKKKRSRIELRIDEKQKQEVWQKCKEININISEYTRQLYKYGEIRIVSEQLTRDIRGMAVNLNQIAKRINSGATSESSVISELQSLLSQLQNTYNNQ